MLHPLRNLPNFVVSSVNHQCSRAYLEQKTLVRVFNPPAGYLTPTSIESFPTSAHHSLSFPGMLFWHFCHGKCYIVDLLHVL